MAGAMRMEPVASRRSTVHSRIPRPEIPLGGTSVSLRTVYQSGFER